MLTSIIYPPKNIQQKLFNSSLTQIDNTTILKIILMKLLVFLSIIFLPLLLNQQRACFICTVLISLQFWTNKNFARVLLKAHWFVDTTTQTDRWIFEAGIKSTKSTDKFQGLFWYSSLCYIMLLGICFVYYLSKGKMSIYCAVFIGLVCAYLNFFAYSKIIKARNQGILNKINSEINNNNMENSQKNLSVVQLPLITNLAELKQIQQEEEKQEYQHI